MWISMIYGSTCTMLVIMYRTYHDFRLYYFNGAFKGEKRLVQISYYKWHKHSHLVFKILYI